MYDYFIVYKPYQVLCQFSAQENKLTLKDYFNVPNNVYPVGRLDFESEGLLILTNDTQLNQKLLHPTHQHNRTYWVQIDGAITAVALQQLEKGVSIQVDGKKYITKQCIADQLNNPIVPERNPPIRYRKNIPAPWISLTLQEGKNRQVRKMTAAVGYPTLRLIRYSIEKLTIQNMQPGNIFSITKKDINEALF
jgi:23S rRNA pseudouridine2457 synthase